MWLLNRRGVHRADAVPAARRGAVGVRAEVGRARDAGRRRHRPDDPARRQAQRDRRRDRAFAAGIRWSTRCIRGWRTRSCRCSPSPMPGSRSAACSLRDALAALPLGIALGAGGRQADRHRAARRCGMRALGWARFPDGMDLRAMLGLGLLCGIGFTMSLFIASLAYPRCRCVTTKRCSACCWRRRWSRRSLGCAWLRAVLPRARARADARTRWCSAAAARSARRCCERLHDAGWRVTAVSRTPQLDDARRCTGCAATSTRVDGLPRAGRCDLQLRAAGSFRALVRGSRASTAPRVIAFGSTSIEVKRGSADPHERDVAQRLREGEQRVFDAAARARRRTPRCCGRRWSTAPAATAR